MKFNEYEALNEKLKQEGTSINEVVFETTGEYLFEAKPDPDKLDTGGDKLKRLTSPRFAKARRKITNNAKKFLEVATKNIVEKYLPKQLEQLKNLSNKAVGMRADDKNPKEILQTLSGELKKMQTIHDKSTLQLEDAIDKMGASFEKRVKSIIDGSEKLNDKSKLKLNIYWDLVSTQVKQKIFNKIIDLRNKSVEELVQNNPEMAELLKVITKLPNTEAKVQELKKKTAEETDKYKKSGEGDDKEKKEFKKGEVYQYTSKNGDTTNLEITEVKEDGEVFGKTKGNPKGFKVRQDAIGKKLKEAPKEEVEAE